MISWYKEKKWPISEMKLEGKIEMHFVGKGFYKLPTDHATPKEHRQAGEKGIELAKKLIKKVDVLILDEINNAIKDGLVDESEVVKLMENRSETHIILTGRGASKRVIEMADLVTECKKIKHPFDKRIKAIKGLDY